jgi:alpha-tubulin suppressor-like RCC1 family protein
VKERGRDCFGDRGLFFCIVPKAMRIVVLLIGIAIGCNADNGQPRSDAGVVIEAGVEAGTGDAGDAGAPADAGAPTDAGAPADAGAGHDAVASCTSNAGCGAGRFCGVASRTCVSAVKAVAPGSFHTCAVHVDGRISCWGDSRFIAPGLPPLTGPVDVPLGRKAVALAAGAQATCALLDDQTVRCWGVFGEATLPPTTIVKEDGTALTAVVQIAGGTVAFCAGHAAGTYCWGDNRAGELGRPASMTFAPQTAVLSFPGARPLLAATVAIVVHDGRSQLCGWGNNDSGIVPGARGIVAQPTCVGTVPNVVGLSAGDGHVCARRGGKLFSCWGSNSGGQLGTGDDSLLDVELPGAIQTLPAAILDLTAGGYHSCALLESGTVMCWGSNERGECGVPSSAPHFAPVLASTPRFVSIASGAEASHTCGVLADGSVQCWGSDERAQLGSAASTEDASRLSSTPQPVRF